MGETALKRLAIAGALGFVAAVVVVGLLSWPSYCVEQDEYCTTCGSRRHVWVTRSAGRDLLLAPPRRFRVDRTLFHETYRELAGPHHEHEWVTVREESPGGWRYTTSGIWNLSDNATSTRTADLLRVTFAHEHDAATREVYARALLRGRYADMGPGVEPRPGERPLTLKALDLEIAAVELAANKDEQALAYDQGLGALLTARRSPGLEPAVVEAER